MTNFEKLEELRDLLEWVRTKPYFKRMVKVLEREIERCQN